MIRLSDSFGWTFGTIASSYNGGYFDFNNCLRTGNGLRPAFTLAQAHINEQEVRRTSEKIIPVLRDKFALF
jgi:hypothetical protein